jgi:Tfp pilus assembly protein PilV
MAIDRSRCVGDGRPLGEAGFSLLEVTFAVTIMVVGVLSVQAMGIQASRTVALAKLESEFAQTATRQLESVSDSVRRNAVACGTRNRGSAATGDSVRVQITGAANRRTITVTVLPSLVPGRVRPDTVQLIRDIYVPGAANC